MEQVTKAKFLEGYEEGYIQDVVAIGNRVYGRDPRGCKESGKAWKVVYAEVTP